MSFILQREEIAENVRNHWLLVSTKFDSNLYQHV